MVSRRRDWRDVVADIGGLILLIGLWVYTVMFFTLLGLFIVALARDL